MSGEEWTHELPVVMEDPMGMHARPAMYLLAYLRQAAPGTRFGLCWGGREVDFGEASEVGPLALLHHADIKGGQEVLALASGPDAEYVLDGVEEVFAQRRTPETHLADWMDIARVVGGPRKLLALQREMWESVK